MCPKPLLPRQREESPNAVHQYLTLDLMVDRASACTRNRQDSGFRVQGEAMSAPSLPLLGLPAQHLSVPRACKVVNKYVS